MQSEARTRPVGRTLTYTEPFGSDDRRKVRQSNCCTAPAWRNGKSSPASIHFVKSNRLVKFIISDGGLDEITSDAEVIAPAERDAGMSTSSRMKKSEVGEVRPSQTLTTYGVGSLVDLPNMSVIVMGLDDWPSFASRRNLRERLLRSAQSILGPQVSRFLTPPRGEESKGAQTNCGLMSPGRSASPSLPFHVGWFVLSVGCWLRSVRISSNRGVSVPSRQGLLRPQLLDTGTPSAGHPRSLHGDLRVRAFG